MGKSKGFTPFWKLLKGTLRLYTFAHNFGIVVPCPSGFEWWQQTKGIMCCQVGIEGIFIPLPMNYGVDKILDAISDANYTGNDKKLKRSWKRLRDALRRWEYFEWEEVDAPKGMPENQEGLMWIKILKWDSSIDERNKLIGEIVCLFYPNSD